MSKTLGELRLLILKTPAGAGIDKILLDGYINARYRQILDANDWRRLIKTGTLQTVAVYETGTITIANGATSGTGSGTTFTAGMTGRKIRPEGRNESYVFTYVSAGAFTIDRAYEGDDLSAGAFKIFKSIYALPSDCERLESVRVPRTSRDLDPVGREYLDERNPDRLWYGAAERYAPADDSSDATPLNQIELDPIPDRAEGYPIRYRVQVAELTATSGTLLPWINPYAIIAGVEADIYMLMEKPQLAQLKEMQFMQFVQGMLRQDAMATEPEALESHSRYTAHRAARANEEYDSDALEFARQNTRGV